MSTGRAVTFDTPRTSTSSNASHQSASHGPTLSYKGPSKLCIKNGKWYDCLRPVPGYKQFGGMGADIDFSSGLSDVQRAGEDESWCDEGDRKNEKKYRIGSK